MPNADPPLILPAASVEAILAATGRPAPVAIEHAEPLGRWLGRALHRAVRRARQRPLTQGDVDKVERAYRRFSFVIEALQDRDEPPPLIPVRDGTTDWEHWICGVAAFGFKRGRPEGSDWRLIAELIAFYEIVSARPASASQDGGPTMRFLRDTLAELADHAPPELRSYFAAPTVDALKQRLPAIRAAAILTAAGEVSRIIGRAG